MAEHDDGTAAAVAHKIGGESPEKKVDHDETAREIIGGEEVLEKTDRDSTVSGKLINKVRGSSSSSSDSEDDRYSTMLKSKVFRLFGREKPVHKVLGGGKRVFSSSSDPVHVSSAESRLAAPVGANRRELGPVGVRRQSSKSPAETSSEIMIQSVQEPMKLVDRLRSLSVKVGPAEYIAGLGVFLSVRGMYQADGSSKIAKESVELQKDVDKRVGEVSQQLTESNELDSCRNYYLCRADYFLSRGWWDSLMGTPYEKKYATEIAAAKKEWDTAAKNRAQKLAKERQDAQKLLREEV